MTPLPTITSWMNRRKNFLQRRIAPSSLANCAATNMALDVALDVSVLEDRVLYSATPLDIGLSDVDGSLADDTSVICSDLTEGLFVVESTDPLLDSDHSADDHDDELDHGHFDVFGNEYHATPAPADIELIGTDEPNDLLAALSGLAPLTETFHLNSNPNAKHTIYLDFDGHVTSGTSWNGAFTGGQDIVTAAYDFDGVANAFSNAELERIQYIWQRVAEDYSPFDVNVTTEAPTVDRLIKSGTGDDAWGVRVVVGGSASDWYGSGAGGVGYVGSFNWSSDTPVFVFEANLGNGSEKYTAECISHEAGHALGLSHDGTSSTTYYAGHGSGTTGWAPIMGNGYYQNVTQWSRGEYLGATNTQDDLAIITGSNGFGYRVDDHGNSDSGASLLAIANTTVTGNGIIERNTDVDVFSFMTDGGNIQLNVNPFVRGPNLDILAELYDASHNLVMASNPLSTLNATINATVNAGMYYLHVSGVGMGDPLSGGYTDYGSLGQYAISGTVVPSDDVFVSIGNDGVQRSEGDSGITSYEFTVTRSGNTALETLVDYQVSGISASAADFAGGVLPGGTLSFAAGETSKVIRVDIAGDTVVELNETFAIDLVTTAATTQILDGHSEGTIVNDDVVATPGIRVSPVSGLTTKESGTSASFSVVLDSRPTADVVIQVQSLDTTEGVVNKSQLTFTSANWNVGQTVTVSGVDDTTRDGNVLYTVQLGAATSADANYNGLDATDVTVTNQDNDSGKTTGGTGGGKGGPRKGLAVEDGPILFGQGADLGALTNWDALVHRFTTNERFADVPGLGRFDTFSPLGGQSHDESEDSVVVVAP